MIDYSVTSGGVCARLPARITHGRLIAPTKPGGTNMDTIALDPRLRHANGFLGRNAMMLIDGKMVAAASGKTFPVYNPATGTLIANVPEAESADVDLAVAAARRAFDSGRWSAVSPSERGKLLWRLADLIE